MSELKRLEDWPSRLDAWIESRRDMPFAWDGNCCISFAIGAVEALTGVRVKVVDWEASEAAAMAAVEAAGGLLAAITAVLGRPGQNWRLARKGDIALAELDGKRVPMVCTGSDLCGPGYVIGADGAIVSQGLMFRPLRDARLVWAVG